MGENMLGMEGPEQAWLRAITETPFRPRDVEERTQGMIPRLAEELIDGFAADGEADLFRAYADPMSVQSLCFMLGLQDVPWQDILRWNEGLMPGLANFEGDPAKQAPADDASAALGAAIGEVLDRLEAEPDGSVLSWMLHHEQDGRRMTRDQIVANTKLMLSGGLQEPRGRHRVDAVGAGDAPRPARGGSGRPFPGQGRGGGDPALGRAGGDVDPPDHARHRARGSAARGRGVAGRRPVVGEP